MRLVVIMVVFLLTLSASAQTSIPPCTSRPLFRVLPRTQIGVCAELLLTQPYDPSILTVGLATGSNGALYFARPLAGQVWTMTDTDGDAVADTLRLLLTGLDAPNALLMVEDSLYIVGGRSLYRWDTQGLVTLADDLPGGTGQPNGGLALHEGRLIVGIGADCDYCTPEPGTRGVLLSMALDGSDRRVIADGMRRPTAITSIDGTLYVSDTASDLEPFDVVQALDTDGTLTRLYRFYAGSNPAVIQAYAGAAFPQFAGDVLVLLAGTEAQRNPYGFQLVGVERFGELHASFSPIVPGDFNMPIITMQPDRPYTNSLAESYVRNGEATYPHQMTGLSIDNNGWIYVLLSNGSIYLLRP